MIDSFFSEERFVLRNNRSKCSTTSLQPGAQMKILQRLDLTRNIQVYHQKNFRHHHRLCIGVTDEKLPPYASPLRLSWTPQLWDAIPELQ